MLSACFLCSCTQINYGLDHGHFHDYIFLVFWFKSQRTISIIKTIDPFCKKAKYLFPVCNSILALPFNCLSAALYYTTNWLSPCKPVGGSISFVT